MSSPPMPVRTPMLKTRPMQKSASQPSIPSRWDPRLTIPKKQKTEKGFGDRVPRFVTKMVIQMLCVRHYVYITIMLTYFQSDVPGPGCYETQPPPYIKQSPSLSKKGYSNAFVSKSYRLRSVYKNDLEVGPGEYDFHPYDRMKDMRKDRIAFLPNGDRNGRVPFPDPLPTPGIGEYNIHIGPGEFDRSKKLKSATFRSRSKRDSYLIGQK